MNISLFTAGGAALEFDSSGLGVDEDHKRIRKVIDCSPLHRRQYSQRQRPRLANDYKSQIDILWSLTERFFRLFFSSTKNSGIELGFLFQRLPSQVEREAEVRNTVSQRIFNLTMISTILN